MRTLNAEKLNICLNKRIESDLSQGRISCADIIINQNGQRLAHITAGSADTSTGLPLPENSMFRLASMTKPVTGVAMLMGVQKGYFSLNDELAVHMPEFASMQVAKKKGDGYVIDHPAKTPIKLWHLLTHVNGIMTEMDLGYRIWERVPKSAYENLKTITAYCAGQPLSFDPERFSAYSGCCPFDIAARLIEIKSGLSYDQFCKRNIFDPLGLSDMTFCPTEDQWQRMTKVHVRTETKSMCPLDMGRHIFETFPLTYHGAGAGLAASAENYSRFAEMLLNGGALDGAEILKPEIFKELPHLWVHTSTIGCDKDSGWGLGVRVVENNNYHLPAGTFGWSGAYGCHFFVDPVNRITAVYLRSNISYPDHGIGDVKLIFEKDVMSCLE